jgi:hypothetical protein
MKHFKIAGLCLVAMLMMGMAVSAATASAAPAWEGCLSGGSTTKYETSACVKASATGTFSWQEINNTDKVTVTGLTLTLRDTKAIGGSSAVQCVGVENEGEGIVGPKNKGKITAAKVKNPKTNCRVIEGACKTLGGEVRGVTGVHFPWQTELFETEHKVLTKIEADGGGEPGWEVNCEGVTDTCESEAGKPEQVRFENALSGGVSLVRGTFEKVFKAKCSVGGAKSGEVEGQLAVLLASGAGLRV